MNNRDERPGVVDRPLGPAKPAEGQSGRRPLEGNQNQQWKCWFPCWVPALFGLIVLIRLQAATQPHLLWFPLLIFGYLAIFVASVILHELGHFIVAKVTRLNPISVTTGQGPELLNGRTNRVHWQIRAYPFSGYLIATSLGLQGKLLASFAMILAGPAVNLLLFTGAAWQIFSSTPAYRHSHWQSEVLLNAILRVNALLLGSLIPMCVKFNGQMQPTDGLHLLHLLKNKALAPVSRTAIVTAESTLPTQTISGTNLTESGAPILHPDPMSLAWQQTLSTNNVDVLLHTYREYLRDKHLPSEARHQWLDAFATLVLFAGASEFLQEANRYSAELFAAKPAEWTVKATRGGVLVELGHLEEGMTILREVLAHDGSRFDRAIAASYLALAHVRKQELD
jgi:hypothetical protein